MGGGDVRLGESRWPNGSACRGRTAGADVSVVEVVGQGLVEHELWDWFGLSVKRLSCRLSLTLTAWRPVQHAEGGSRIVKKRLQQSIALLRGDSRHYSRCSMPFSRC